MAITGVGGFIGMRMAGRALEEGWEVRGVDIDEGAVRRAEEAGVRAVVGDINDIELLQKLFEGVDLVFHTAAIVDETGSHELFYRVNVHGTQAVARAATQTGVSRLVHLSSVMVYGFEYPDGVDETHACSRHANIYCETKRVSDDVAMGFHRPGGLEVIVIRPGDVYGPGSRPWVLRPVEAMRSGLFNLPGGGRGLVNHVHVDNLLDAVFLALEKSATGEVFNVTDGRATSCLEFFRYHTEMLGKKRVPTMPTPLLRALLTVSAPVWRLRGLEPPATQDAIDFLLRSGEVSSNKARDMLGYEARVGLEEGMKMVERELRAAGRLG